MYINLVRITNIRSIRKLVWKIPAGKEAGWHVVIGDNGSGKSTFLRAVALSLIGPSESDALIENWGDWPTRGESKGQIWLDLSPDAKLDKFSGKGKRPTRSFLPARVQIVKRNGDVFVEEPIREEMKGKLDPDNHIWSGKPGWFSAAYGPFRRFTGGDEEDKKIFSSKPRLAAHLSVFRERTALTECLEWLKDLNYKKLENKPEGDLLDQIEKFVNQEGFLPHQARLHKVSSDGVEFIDGNGCQLLVEDLSDGYRSILSMTFELIRQLSRTYGQNKIFDPDDPTKVTAPGVVLIDEVDAHLHPTWQRKIGLWFRQRFPKLQFIVTTHSPLVCQAADVGSVYRLPKPGSDEQGEMIIGTYLDRLLYGNVMDAYGTQAFGKDVTRSEESKKRLHRLAELNRKELRKGLSEAEKKEQEKLRATLPTSAHKMEP